MRKKCPNKALNEEDCPCPHADCENHGICCQCVRHHNEFGGRPACVK